jgi:hypothetical protein
MDDFIAWTKHDANWTWNELNVQRSQLALPRLRGDALWTFYHTIQWNFLEDHQLLKKLQQLNIL